MSTSAVSGRTALKGLFVTCEDTGKRALPDEVANCGETGKRVLRSRLRRSSKTKRLALAELTGECAACGNVLLNSDDSVRRDRPVGARLAQDKLFPSAYSGKRLRQSAAQLSEASGRVAGPGELVTSRSGMRVLPDELEQCPACGQPAVLQPFAQNDRFECASCALLCCKADRTESGGCLLCETAQTGTEPREPPAEVLARAPKMKSWFAGVGATQSVWVGRPGRLRLFAKAVLIRAATLERYSMSANSNEQRSISFESGLLAESSAL